ncbi:hypothetical protein PACTADRAFT_77078 [Pachysolen tannophilus NRRL Y-2460]|uniref:Amino acid permease/ SLC12A domain-containing protein n=1 Tax=Pachysolen tannophilus NRRL Y-2460 TaxID=669874 RepID=A0A1E4TRY2_PACTA|nr:hypothetical protein PACTADRAFT_77078 [Pachysolen tannophilus NRRL Y-2460]
MSKIAQTLLYPIWGSTEDDTSYNLRGTPSEKTSPLGYSNNLLTTVYLVLHGIVGTGIFSTPATILNSIGSVGASYVLWITCWFISLFNVLIYIEFVTYFPNRNGGDVAYLEQSYPEPKFMIATVYAAVSVVLSYATSSAIAFSQYILKAADAEATTWRERGIAAGVLTGVCLMASINTKYTLKISNILSFVKVVFLAFIAITGLVVLGGHTRVRSPTANFQNAWEGTTSDGNAIANSIIDVTFSYSGFSYAFAVVAEHQKSAKEDPIRTYKTFVPLTLFVIFIFYILIITAYYAGSGTIEEIKDSGNTVVSTFFSNVFGTESATKAMSSLVALSALGHLLTAVVSHSRALRECGRQGVLPFRKFWIQVKPFGTPIGPLFITWLVNIIVILAPPAGSAYNFVVDLGTYSSDIFSLVLVIGLLQVRRQRKKAGLGYAGYKVPTALIIILILFQLLVIAIVWVPPSNGTLIGSDVTFFYATYPIVTIGLILLCIGYYLVWYKVLPKLGKFEYRYSVYRLNNGELGNSVIKVPLDKLDQWDSEHTEEIEIEPIESIYYEEF